MVTLRVYDYGKDFADRYTLYYPTPRNKVAEWECMGVYLGFNFSESTITKFCYSECHRGVGIDFFGGKKIKRETLPTHVQEWINKQEMLYNKAIKEDTTESWVDWENS